MSDDYQIDIPPSFFAVYTDARQRLAEPIAVVRARYEVCEDLANHLVQQAQLLHHVEVPSEDEILRRIHAGLCTPDAGVPAGEAEWIVRRLAELLNWNCPPLGDSGDSPEPDTP
ncbi:hypothetical protein SRS16CHR_05434 [Variovorax sp. SRS16]|uniref:hypothetical protein n=1 Tax=Variovorax sp. SRS16 TaxID=282217 RepID=UPI0013186295|nr:hypothetical protein [Variovorax sp. SRS16]VTU34172.1 hypothetical protein SRS16CHR_05434 [Variovorax sp. SRS16]